MNAINKIIHFSVYHRYIVLAVTLSVAVAGFIGFQRLPIDAVPDITNNQVQVNTTVEGLAPEEIERSVTFPVESSMRGIAGVTQVRSITRFGLSQVTIVFEDDTDIYRMRQLVSERLQRIASDLPKDAKPQLGPISTGLGEVYQYTLDFDKPAADPDERFKQLIELRAIQDWYLKPRLLTVPGVAEVNTTGGFEKQYHVRPDPEKMARYALHFSNIIDALEKANQNVGGGYIEQTSEQFLVQGVGLFQGIDDIKKVPIKSLETFRTITVGDVASVGLGKELRTGAATMNGRETVLGTVMMLVGENSRAVSTRIHEKLQEVSKGLPQGVIATTVYNRSDLVNATLGTVEHNLVMGASLVIVILLLLLGNVRAAVITSITIPLSLLITFLIMKPLGISGNLMSLGALDFGIIVDGVVIVIDNCVRRVEERVKATGKSLTKNELLETISSAAVEIRTAAGFGELIIIVVFLPIFGLTGIEGKMFMPMAATFVIALFAALALSFTTAPALASVLLSGNTEDKEPKLMRSIRAKYHKLLDWSLKRREKTLLGALASVMAGIVLFLFLGGEFLPQLSEGSFAFHMIRPANISLTRAIEYQKKAEEVVQSFPEVKFTFARLGTSEIATDPMGVNVADCYIMLKARSEWPGGKFFGKKTYEELTADIVDRLERELPGMRFLASQPIQMRFNELLEGTRADVTVKVFGPDLNKLVEIGKEMQEVISEVKGAGDVELDIAGQSPVLKIEPKTEVLNRYGIQKGEVLEAVTIALGGEEVGHLYEKDRRYPIVVRLDESLRSDLDAIRSLPVGVTGSSTAPLTDLADVSFKETFSVINREESNRRTAVMINLRGRDTESFVEEAQKIVSSKVKVPEGYYVQWGGNFKNLQEAKDRLVILTPIALLLVLAMIYIAFGSLAQTALIFVCVPLALVGGVMGLMIFRLPFSISAGVGFIALSGIAVLNGVVLVNYFNQLRATKGMSGLALIEEGALIRLRPVLMTALVDIFGFLPMVLSTGIGAEVQRPLAAVVIGGVISSTMLTLLVVPAMYAKFEKWMADGKVAH
ncbi:MAG: efflux RND transporter permease subunit [Bdellovibrionales bacterium]|nr:efflux RND transporter permease subunit [Bdellovibrionales bacterium]